MSNPRKSHLGEQFDGNSKQRAVLRSADAVVRARAFSPEDKLVNSISASAAGNTFASKN